MRLARAYFELEQVVTAHASQFPVADLRPRQLTAAGSRDFATLALRHGAELRIAARSLGAHGLGAPDAGVAAQSTRAHALAARALAVFVAALASARDRVILQWLRLCAGAALTSSLLRARLATLSSLRSVPAVARRDLVAADSGIDASVALSPERSIAAQALLARPAFRALPVVLALEIVTRDIDLASAEQREPDPPAAERTVASSLQAFSLLQA
jgi:hypothetical protein